MIKRNHTTQERVKELFYYKDGALFYKENGTRRFKDKEVGWQEKKIKYKRMSVDCRGFLVHRIIFLFHYGYLPQVLDHIDNNPLNNKIENLRETTNTQNVINTPKVIRKGTTSKYKGVSRSQSNKYWIAQIYLTRKTKTVLGKFKTERAAALRYIQEAQKHFGEFINLKTINSNNL